MCLSEIAIGVKAGVYTNDSRDDESRWKTRVCGSLSLNDWLIPYEGEKACIE